MHRRDDRPVFVEIASNRAEERGRDRVRCVRGKAQPNVIIRRERVDRRACRANLRVYILAAKSKQLVEDARRHLCVAKQGDCGKRIRHIADERTCLRPERPESPFARHRGSQLRLCVPVLPEQPASALPIRGNSAPAECGDAGTRARGACARSRDRVARPRGRAHGLRFRHARPRRRCARLRA